MTTQTPGGQLAELLIQRRKELKIRQEDLSELTGIALRTIRDIERSKANPSLDTINKLMEALGIVVEFRLRK